MNENSKEKEKEKSFWDYVEDGIVLVAFVAAAYAGYKSGQRSTEEFRQNDKYNNNFEYLGRNSFNDGRLWK